jgi:hypothetical protein
MAFFSIEMSAIGKSDGSSASAFGVQVAKSKNHGLFAGDLLTDLDLRGEEERAHGITEMQGVTAFGHLLSESHGMIFRNFC